MARFCAKIRQHASLSDVSMRDIYLNPTIAKLAAHLGKAVAVAREPRREHSSEPFRIPSNLAYYGCGALQALFYVATGALGLWVIDAGLRLDRTRRSTTRASSICAAWRSRSGSSSP